ncbi:MAG: hypothetical protein Q8S13_07390 [Dehalococcoidia bacterium]|nr:hypothetical protein [Dehalococcoidia bacterium]
MSDEMRRALYGGPSEAEKTAAEAKRKKDLAIGVGMAGVVIVLGLAPFAILGYFFYRAMKRK